MAEGLPLLGRHYKLEQDPKAVGPLHTNMLTLLPALKQAFRSWQSRSGTGLPPSLTYTVTSHRGRSSQPDTWLNRFQSSREVFHSTWPPRGSSSPPGQLCKS